MEAFQEVVVSIAGISYIGLFITGFLAQAVIPVPEELVLLALGYVISLGGLNWFIAVPVVIGGMLLSDIIIFYLSYSGNKIVYWVYNKIFAKIVPMDEPFIRKHIKPIIVVSRFMIQLRFLGPFFAGYIKTPFKTFIQYDFPSAVVYAGIYMGMGIFFNKKIELIIGGINQAKNIVFIVLGIIIAISLTKGLKKIILDWYTKKEQEEHAGNIPKD